MDLPDIIREATVRRLIRGALAEDIGAGDVTSLALVPEDTTVGAVILARDACVVSGTGVARAVFARVDRELKYQIAIGDGQSAAAGAEVMTVTGSARSILAAERTALNFMQRMTGVATLTRRFVEKVKPYGTRILDTRKTTPTLRLLEKYAVLCGQGCNHRMGLYDMVLIKDNHRRLLAAEPGRGLGRAVTEARKRFPGIPVEVEVETEADLRDALSARPDWILLDNMPPELMRRCVEISAGVSRLEASGGITLENVEQVAATGVDAISLGCLTHSVPSADLSLEIR